MAQDQVLFCPFCRESFEGVGACPEHDLPLVPFHKLGPDPLAPPAAPKDDEALAWWEIGYGRGWVAASALLHAVALGLPLTAGGPPVFALAVVLPSLWTLGLVSFTLFFVLLRRRTPRALRGLRVLVPLLGLVSLLTLGLAFSRLAQGLSPLLGSLTSGIDRLAPGAAVYVIALAAALTLFGGIKLGVDRR